MCLLESFTTGLEMVLRNKMGFAKTFPTTCKIETVTLIQRVLYKVLQCKPFFSLFRLLSSNRLFKQAPHIIVFLHPAQVFLGIIKLSQLLFSFYKARWISIVTSKPRLKQLVPSFKVLQLRSLESIVSSSCKLVG